MRQGHIRILHVEDNESDARLVEEYLSESMPGRFELIRADRLSAALQQAGTEHFDLILLDLRLPDTHGIETFRAMRAGAPETPIVVLTGLGDDATGVSAVEEGAQDYLVKGKLGAESLTRAVRYAVLRFGRQAELLEKAEEARRGKVVGFIGAKGGVGTSSVALEFAAALVQRHKTAVLAEVMSHPASLSSWVGRAPVETVVRVAGLGSSRISKREVGARMVALASGIRVLFGPQRQEECETVDPGAAASVVDRLAEMAQFAVIDLGSHCSDVVRAAVLRCDHVAVVMQPGPVGTKMARATVGLLRSWGLDGDRMAAVIVNRGPAGACASIAECHTLLGCVVVGVVPSDPDAFHSAELRGTPVVLDEPDSMAATSIVDMAWRLAADKITPMRS